MASDRSAIELATNATAHAGQGSVGTALIPLLTVNQVAQILQISPKTVRRLVTRGFPHVRFGRVIRFTQADVFRFIEARKE